MPIGRSVGMLWVVALLFASSAIAQQPYSKQGAAACLECHESDRIMGIVETPHADFINPRSPASREQCESCHGPSATHMNFPMQVGNIRFSKHDTSTSVALRNATCMECHGTAEEKDTWEHSPHGFEEVACADCHSSHKSRDPILSEAEQTLRCTEGCHETILSTAPARSPHPLTGKDRMSCTGCHNPHGPLDYSTCASCHPQDAAALARETPKARGYHERAIARKIECTSCHKGFVHATPEIHLSGAAVD